MKSAHLQFHFEEMPLISFSAPPNQARSYPFLFYLVFFPVFHFNNKHIIKERDDIQR